MADKYPRPSLTADILVFCRTGASLELLLIRRKNPPFAGCFALPGGFVEPTETAAAAAARELAEETGLTGLPLLPLGLYDTPGRDPRGWVVSQAFLTLFPRTLLSPIAGDDAKEADFFTVTHHRTDRTLTLTLTRPDDVLTADLDLTERTTPLGVSRETALRLTNGLAFDHARLIGDGLLALADRGLLP